MYMFMYNYVLYSYISILDYNTSLNNYVYVYGYVYVYVYTYVFSYISILD